MSPPHHYCSTIKMGDLSPHLTCVLCSGYFIDATTIIECLHSFCRTCIVRYLESSKFCPICEVQVHKTRPLTNIRSDKTLQDLVYKLVPNLFAEEMRRRREFLKEHSEVKTEGMDLEQRGLAIQPPVHCLPEDRISLILQLTTLGRCYRTYSDNKSSSLKLKRADRRYLMCPSDVSVGTLKNFIRNKFGLSDKLNIDVFHEPSQDIFSDEYTLLDITFLCNWTREKPLRLCYSVYGEPQRKRRISERLYSEQSTQAKRARLEWPGFGITEDRHTHKSAVPTQELIKNNSKSANGRATASRQGHKFTSAAYSACFAKDKIKKIKKDCIKLGIGSKVKREKEWKKSSGDDKRTGAVKGSLSLTTPSRHDRRPVNSKARCVAEKGGSMLGVRDMSLSHRTPSKKKDKDGRPTSSNCKKSASRSANSDGGKSKDPSLLSTSEQGASTALTNGIANPSLTTNRPSCNRSSNSLWSDPSSIRADSPRLCSQKSSWFSSHTPRGKLRNGKDSARVSKGKRRNVVIDGKDCQRLVCSGGDSPRLSSGGSSRTVSPKPCDLPSIDTASFRSLPVQDKITVDVSMAAASETSSDVTSPGAEDRANSTNLEEGGDFDSGNNVCIVSSFTSRALPTIEHLHTNGHGQRPDKVSVHLDRLSRPSQGSKVANKTANSKKR